MKESGQWPARSSGKANPGSWVIHFSPEPGVFAESAESQALVSGAVPCGCDSVSQFPYLQLVDNESISSGLLEGLQEIMHQKLLAQCLAKDNVSNDWEKWLEVTCSFIEHPLYVGFCGKYTMLSAEKQSQHTGVVLNQVARNQGRFPEIWVLLGEQLGKVGILDTVSRFLLESCVEWEVGRSAGIEVAFHPV